MKRAPQLDPRRFPYALALVMGAIALASLALGAWFRGVAPGGFVQLVNVVAAMTLVALAVQAFGALRAGARKAPATHAPGEPFSAQTGHGSYPVLVACLTAFGLACPVAMLTWPFAVGAPALHFLLASLVTLAPSLALAFLMRPLALRGDEDAVTIEHRFGRKVYPWRQVADISQKGGAVRVLLADGRVEVIPIDDRVEMDAVAVAHSLGVLRRRALARSAPPEGGQSRWAVLDRNGRTVEAWREALQGVLHGGFRATSVTRDDLLRLLDDPETPAERRIAAALALQSESDNDVQLRVRVAVETTVEPKVRVALDAALDGELDEVMVTRAADEWRSTRAVPGDDTE